MWLIVRRPLGVSVVAVAKGVIVSFSQKFLFVDVCRVCAVAALEIAEKPLGRMC